MFILLVLFLCNTKTTYIDLLSNFQNINEKLLMDAQLIINNLNLKVLKIIEIYLKIEIEDILSEAETRRNALIQASDDFVFLNKEINLSVICFELMHAINTISLLSINIKRI